MMEFPSFSLEDKVSLITGGSKGIGWGMAAGLANAGSDLVIVSRNREELENAAHELSRYGTRVVPIPCDVSDAKQVQSMVERALQEMGRLDVLLNNAGMNIRKPLSEYEETDWDQVISVNLKGIFLVGREVAKRMIPAGGSIINISSIFGSVAMPYQTGYAASKGGINQLTRVWATELAPHRIRVNAIAPAYIETPMTSGWLHDPERLRQIVDSTPLGRLGRLQDLTGPVVFLASDASGYVTGHVLHVDGGWTAR
jgi:2-deoxy-D-gluconate 3-dehydrogenase